MAPLDEGTVKKPTQAAILGLHKYVLPSHATAQAFPILFSSYVVVLGFARSFAITQVERDTLNGGFLLNASNFSLGNASDGDVPVSVPVNSVSNAVMWACRKGSNSAHFYRTIYLISVIFLVFHTVTAIIRFFTVKFWKLSDKGYHRQMFKAVYGTILLYIAFVFLFFSFDISPWACLSQPSDLVYDFDTGHVEIDFPPSVLRWQKAGAIISAVSFLIWAGAQVAWIVKDSACGNGCCDDCNLQGYEVTDGPKPGLVTQLLAVFRKRPRRQLHEHDMQLMAADDAEVNNSSNANVNDDSPDNTATGGGAADDSNGQQ